MAPLLKPVAASLAHAETWPLTHEEQTRLGTADIDVNSHMTHDACAVNWPQTSLTGSQVQALSVRTQWQERMQGAQERRLPDLFISRPAFGASSHKGGA